MDPHANIISGTLTWGDIPTESMENVEEWAFYLSLDGETADSTAIIVVDASTSSYLIPPDTNVGFNRYLLMYGRNGGGDGETFSAFPFVDKCDICVTAFEFENVSGRNLHIRGDVVFNSRNQHLISKYKVYVGRDPFTEENVLVGAIAGVDKAANEFYRIPIPELNVNGMPYIWVRSFYLDGNDDNTPTGDVAWQRISYYTGDRTEVLSADRDVIQLGDL